MPAKRISPDKVISPAAVAIRGADAFSALGEIVGALREYGRVREEELTKRAAIEAQALQQVTRIQAAEEILKLYFDQAFAERSQTSAEMFKRLDQALASGDPHAIHSVVQGIVGLAQASPLAGFGDFGRFWAELGTPDNPVDL